MYRVKDSDFESWYAALLDKIRAEADMQGLSVRSLADLAGVSSSTVWQTLRWVRCPNIVILYRIMAALEIDFDRVTRDYNEEKNKRNENR